jgi:hypothetical protein
VPAVHIVETPDGDEEVLDGQQRLAAIRDFFHDKFPVDGHTDPADPSIRELHGLKFSKLPEKIQRNLRRFELPVVRLRDFRPSEPNELFFRLNQSYTLTPPEKRNALHGPARNQVKELVKTLESIGLLRPEKVGFSNGRLAYDDIVARTCVALQQADLSVHINNAVVERFYRTEEFDPYVIDAVERSSVKLLSLIESSADRVRFNKGSLFSWLVFGFWHPQITKLDLPDDALAAFEHYRLASRRGIPLEGDLSAFARAAVSAYDDRAAYRVTDVSSVLIRDASLHLFVSEFFRLPSVPELQPLLDMDESDPSLLVGDIARFVDTTRWSGVLRRAVVNV